jgi:cyclopropane-fatty-acyl-phospholipid synthase
MANISEACLRNKSSLSQNILFKILRNIRFGKITLIECDQQNVFLGQEGIHTHDVTVVVKDKRFFKQLLLTGTNGAADSYIQGQWETNQLTQLIEIILINDNLFQGIDNPFAIYLGRLVNFFSAVQKNYKKTAKKNILAHYDLGNDFFQLFLDKSMMYSCAVYPSENSSLEEASNYKLKQIAQSLQLSPDDHLLEIGTGWGGFAIFAAREYGCKVTTTTISDHQFAYVTDKIQQLGLQQQITVLNKDYRELQGKYDKLVSIEMIEAVGHHFLEVFFKKCNALVKPGGLFFLQAITINDQAYHKAKNEMDFIKRYIFPGGCLPSLEIITHCITRYTKMQLLSLQDIGEHYAVTLMDWRERFYAALAAIQSLGFSDAFIRTWDLYFCYCAAGFRQRYISNVHALWQRLP